MYNAFFAIYNVIGNIAYKVTSGKAIKVVTN